MKIDKLVPEEQKQVKQVLAKRRTPPPPVEWNKERWLWFDTNDAAAEHLTLLSVDHTRMVRGVPIKEVEFLIVPD